MDDYGSWVIDARSCPWEVQEIAYEKGLIPYIHADMNKVAGTN